MGSVSAPCMKWSRGQTSDGGRSESSGALVLGGEVMGGDQEVLRG